MRRIIRAAAAHGDMQVHILQWMLDRGRMIDAGRIRWFLIKAADVLPVVKWLHAHGRVLPAGVSVVATRRVNLDLIEWLIDHGYQMSTDACREAAAAGGLRALRRLRARLRREASRVAVAA